ncbi:MAG: hypothetical protein KKF06_07985, partial [Candidatus Margulisbacteria bacterium]|nr:hypothetical protein [Candidatus Margulisiibacteriota bacterium]
MAESIQCINQFNQMLQRVDQEIDPASFLKDNFLELLKERVIIDTEGNEINGRLTELLGRATEDARENQRTDLLEPLARAIVRNALRRLRYSCDQTLGGLPTGPAYERSMPDAVTPAQFGHEKVGYPMSDYPRLSFLPVGGLGAPLCEIDYSTCYLREGFMVQDAPIRQMNVTITSPSAPPVRANLNSAEGTYSALYPLSERTYDLPIPFSVTQYSPVIPGDYRSSSLPVEIIEVNAENPTDKPVTITFTLSQENILGWYPKKGKDDPNNPHGNLVWNRQNEGNYAESFEHDNVTGLLFQRAGDNRQQVRVEAGFAGEIAIASPSSERAIVSANTQNNSLTITLTLQPGERVSHPITVAYDLPFYNFQYDPTNPASPGARMPKFYTRFYDETGQNARRMALDALRDRTQWRQEIARFQNTITDDPTLPDFFKQALLNELYVLPETGIWEATEGRFAYLESIDYKMYNTSDVNSYTWALLALFPELERNDLLELARLTPLLDSTHRWFGTDRYANIPPPEWKHLYWAPVKDAGAVCHDLGGLLGEGIFPFRNTCNEFNWSNANMWIDLAPKFALRAQRYLSFMAQQGGVSGTRTEEMDFLAAAYPAVKLALDTLERRWGERATHLPVSKGIPDWTYDTISG